MEGIEQYGWLAQELKRQSAMNGAQGGCQSWVGGGQSNGQSWEPPAKKQKTGVITPAMKSMQAQQGGMQRQCKWCQQGQCWTHQGVSKTQGQQSKPQQTKPPQIKPPKIAVGTGGGFNLTVGPMPVGPLQDEPQNGTHFTGQRLPIPVPVASGAKPDCQWCKKGECWTHVGGAANKKRKREDGQGQQLPSESNICWDFVKNQCHLGDACPFDHAITSAALNVKAHEGTKVKGRTEEDKAASKIEYQSWAEERLISGVDPTGTTAAAIAPSSDFWFCQVCLVCQKECDWNVYQKHHKGSKTHLAAFIKGGGFMLKPEYCPRPDPDLVKPMETPSIPRFISCGGFGACKVLTLGEQDYSFSLAVAKTQLTMMSVAQTTATSYLAAHDPSEPEVHVRDDGMRAHYSRRSLPSMDGALQKNIDALCSIGGTCLHSVDATDLPGTLLTQTGDTYNVIIFPFPRASLMRGCCPKNPRLLRNFFRSVNAAAILEPGGKIGVILLRTQYAEWDMHCLAAESGYYLIDHTPLPPGFYQGREMSGKIFDSWQKIGAEIYMFQLR